MIMKNIVAIFSFGIVLLETCWGGTRIDLWSSPDRIPLLLVAPNGTLLAFAEDRINPRGNSDRGYINVALRRSTDNGATWTNQQTVATDGVNTFSVGAGVSDSKTGKIFLFVGWNLFGDDEDAINNGTSADTRKVYLTSSTDNGTNWSPLAEVTSTTKSAGWRWIAPGPAPGIELSSGRLLVPFYHSGTSSDYHPHVVYSDDDGATWNVGGSISTSGYSECSLVKLTDDKVMMIARNDRGEGKCGVATSSDSGTTWSAIANSDILKDPGCESSFIRYTCPPEYVKPRLLFANPPTTGGFYNRQNVTVRLSYNEGITWPVSKQYFPSKSGYSSLAILPNGKWAILCENGTSTSFDKITFFSDSLENLTGGADHLDPTKDKASPSPRLAQKSGIVSHAVGTDPSGSKHYDGGEKDPGQAPTETKD